MRDPIYKPKGAAAEYGELALNIYQGCVHGCSYCYVPAVLRIDRETFHSQSSPRPGIIEATEKQLAKGKIQGQTIFLCFTCDPYPVGCDSTATREIIKLIKESGNHVKILTKGGRTAQRDLDLLDDNDWFGITLSGASREDEPGADYPFQRVIALKKAKSLRLNTWISCEPVINPENILMLMDMIDLYVDHWAIGKLNHKKSDVDWADFGNRAERRCKSLGLDYTIKDDLRKEMAK